MNTNHSSLIRGLYVAITVLAALSLISCVVAVASMNIVEKYLYDALEQQYYEGEIFYDYDRFYDELEPYLDDEYDYDDYWYDDDDWYDDDWGYEHDHSYRHHTGVALMPVRGHSSIYSSEGPSSFAEAYAMTNLAVSIANGLLIWEIVVSVVSLLFGILGLVNAGNPAKLRQIMGVSIAGAVISFLGGHIILVALFIIAAVMANKDKTALLNPPTPPLS